MTKIFGIHDADHRIHVRSRIAAAIVLVGVKGKYQTSERDYAKRLREPGH